MGIRAARAVTLAVTTAVIAVAVTTTAAAAGNDARTATASKGAGLSAVTDGTRTATGGYAAAVLSESSLVDYWRLGEGSGGAAVDQKGSANGSYRDGVALAQSGALAGDPDTAAGFDGSSGFVSLPALGASVSDFTLEGWTNLAGGASTSPFGNNTMFGAWGSVRLAVRPNGVYAGVWVGGDEYRVQVGTSSNVGSWVHWAMVRSGDTLTVYRNASAVGSVSALPAGTTDLRGTIGAQGGNAYWLHGSVDEVAIYTSALPATTIQQHYQTATRARAIHVNGNELLDVANQKVRLQGFQRAGTSYACEQGFGFTDGPSGDSEFQPMISWGANTVYLGLNEDCWLGINGVPAAYSGQNYIDFIKSEVTSAEKYGLYPAIGFDTGDPGADVPNINDGSDGQPPMPDNDHTPLFWEEVADTFKTDSHVIFRLQNEPHPAGNGIGLNAWRCWSTGDVQYGPSSDQAPPAPPVPVSSNSNCSESDAAGHAYQTVGMQSLVNIIRGVGATNVIQVPGVSYANMYSCSSSGSPASCGFLDSADGVRIQDRLSPAQLMGDTDNYPDSGQYCNTTACYDATYAPVAQVMPIEGGEVGVLNASNPFPQFQAIMRWFKAHNASTYAAAWDTWSSLISDYNGAQKAPVGTWLYAFMTGSSLPPVNTALPTITGTAQSGQKLTADPGTWTNSPTYAYQWRKCPTATTCSNIAEATGSSYTLQSSDVGDTVDVIVTATNGDGSASATSAPTATVTAAPSGPPPSEPMPLISRGLPAFSSPGQSQCGGFFQDTLNGDTNSRLNSTDYRETGGATCYGFLSTTTFPSWVAYNLSSVPAVQSGQMSRLLSTWLDGVNYNYDFAQDYTGDSGTMRDYTIDVACQDLANSALPTNGWVTKATITGNTLRSRSDVIDMSDPGGTACKGNYNWVRINASAGNTWNNFQFKWDLWNASTSLDDTWMFYGDSITNVWKPEVQYQWGTEGTFAQEINAWDSALWPSFENGATGGKTSTQYVQSLTTHDGGLYPGGDSTPWLPKTPAHFMVFALGTNDCNAGDGPTGLQTNLGQLVDAALNDPTWGANRVVIIPHLQASPNLRAGTNTVQMWNGSSIVPTSVTGNDNGPLCNQAIDQVVKDKQAQYGANRVLAGPDMWAATVVPTSHWGDGLHPFGDAQGIGLYSDAWIQWAETNVYGTLIK